MQKKNYWQRVFACAVLLSVLSVGTLAEAGNFKYRVDGVTEGTWDGADNIRLNDINIGGGTGIKLEVWEEASGAVSSYNIFGSGYTGSTDSNDYSGKTVIFHSGQVNSIFGGSARLGNANGNIVTINDGVADGSIDVAPGPGPVDDDASAVNSTVYGGYSYKGSTSGNKVTFNGGAAKFVYGGMSEAAGAGDSTENTVTINAGTTIYLGNVYGGFSNGGEVGGNKVIINGGDLSDASVYGYNDGASSHSDNILQINNSVAIKKVANFEVIDIFNAGSVTINELTVGSNCILKVDGAKITGTAAITGITSATVASGAKLYVGSAVPNKNYKILEGSGINVDADSWRTDEDMGDGFRAMYGLLVDNVVSTATEFTIRFKEDPLALKKLDMPNIYANMPMGSALQKFAEDISVANPNLYTQAAIINTMANMNSLANVQQGTQAVMGMATGALQTNIGTGSRGMLGRRAEGVGRNSGNRGQVSGVRNVSANADDRGAIEVVEQGKSDEVMPMMVGNETLKYDKTVWANYIHSKKTINGLKTGHLTQNSTIQYNGITVGADLWSNAKGFGGIALTTATGKTNSSQNGASVKNDTDYHGISLYQRYDYKDVALLFDLSYTHAKNDVFMSAAGTLDVTARPKSDAYSAGVKVEYPVKLENGFQLTPYAGLRYTHIHTGKYENSLGISNDIKDQDIVSLPLGVQLKKEYTTNSDWKFGHIFEGGYVLNVGNRKSEQRLGHQGVYDSIDFDVTDRGEYFLKTALTAKHKDTDFELGYRHTRGDNTKENKWNFNVTHNFGNSKGLPYKSVLLGKIDLLESANKELRAELVEKDLRIKQLEEELRKLKNK